MLHLGLAPDVATHDRSACTRAYTRVDLGESITQGGLLGSARHDHRCGTCRDDLRECLLIPGIADLDHVDTGLDTHAYGVGDLIRGEDDLHPIGVVTGIDVGDDGELVRRRRAHGVG